MRFAESRCERPEWLPDEEKRSAAVRHLPVEGKPPVELPLVVEYYATRL